MHAPPTEPRRDPLDALEYERTLVGLYLCHTAMLCGTRRQPRRVLWTDYHAVCKKRLEASSYSDRELALLCGLCQL